MRFCGACIFTSSRAERVSGGIAIVGGLVLTALGWLAPRIRARAPPRLHWVLILDMAGPFGLWAILFAATARPWFAGAASFATFIGFAFADATKRATLREPVAFSDMSEFFEMFRHPELYLPQAGPRLVLGGAAAIFIALAAVLVMEPARWPWSPWPGLIALGLAVLFALATSREPVLSRFADLVRRAEPRADLAIDAVRLGPLGVLPVYGIIARTERAWRCPPLTAPNLAPRARATGAPIVMVQCESFFDARRLHPAIPADLIPHFAQGAATGIQSGRFGVSGWGAYTVRAELAALTGLTDEAIGYDRWNPYHAFVRAPMPSLAWRLRAEGYRTLCLHPFDRRYYNRHKIMPRLGFDTFLGEEEFAGAERHGLFIADAAVARRARAILADEGPGLFLFIITMENHGPWDEDSADAASPDPVAGLPTFPARDMLRRYLRGVRRTDAMLGEICGALADGPPGGLLAAYGDHLPSLPAAFAALDFTAPSTDYAIWTPGISGPARQLDLAASDLPAAILAARGAMR